MLPHPDRDGTDRCPITDDLSVGPAHLGRIGRRAHLVVVALVVALAVAIPLLVRASHRREWRDELASSEDEVAWFARGLIPQLRQIDAVRAARGQIQALLEAGRQETMTQDLDAVAARLEQVLGAGTPLD